MKGVYTDVMQPTAQQIRSVVEADPNTAEIAAMLSVPYTEYVDRVVEFAMNPSLQPEIYIADDETLKAMGAYPPPTEAELIEDIKGWAASMKVLETTEFETSAPERNASLLSGEGKRDFQELKTPANPDLLAEFNNRRRRGQ